MAEQPVIRSVINQKHPHSPLSAAVLIPECMFPEQIQRHLLVFQRIIG